MSTQIISSVLDNLTVFHLSIGLAQGRKKLKAEDIGIAEPNKELISLGSKKVFDLSRLLPFRMARNESLRLCRTAGTRFMDSPNLFAVANADAITLANKLTAIQVEFLANKATFLPEVDQVNRDWQLANPNHEQALKETFSTDYFDRALNYNFHAARIGMSNDPVLDQPLVSNVLNLGDVLIQEVAEDAAETMKTSFTHKSRCTHKVFAPLRRLSSKLKSLGFLSPIALHVAKLIDETLAVMPPAGSHIEGSDFYRLKFMVETLSDEAKVHAFLNGSRIQNDDEVIDELIDEVIASDVNDEEADDSQSSTMVPPPVEQAPTHVSAWF